MDTLIDEALADAPTIAVAQARLHPAQAAAQIAGSELQPQLAANASTSVQKQSYNFLSPPAVTPHGWNDYGRATLDGSWNLDLWGKNRAALAAATSDADAARADAAQARLTLATAIAAAYAELARESAALDTQHAAREVRAKTAELVRQRYDYGLETLAAVRQADARRAAAEEDVLSISEQLAPQRNRIAALAGAGPDRGLSIGRPVIDLARPFQLPARLPADLLGRRPDIVAARLRAEAAARRIDSAERAFYPDVSLVAFFGVQSLGLDSLSRSGSSVGDVGPAISLPIFTGGRTVATTDMTYWQISMPLILTGIGLPFSFVPLTALALASVRDDGMAAAAGLQNFLRTLSVAVAASAVTTAWDSQSSYLHAELVGLVDRTGDVARTLASAGFSSDAVLATLDYLTQSQSVMLATNRILWTVALVFALAAAIIWIAPRPTRSVDLSRAGH